jgi:tRNA threonylcarbamoyladenosine biosynthesis protein TsaE
MNAIVERRGMSLKTIELLSKSPTETQALGARLGAMVEAGDIIALEGELGAGKTCLAQGIGQGMGVQDPIISPTFTLIREYQGVCLPLFHIDCYRLESLSEAWALGLDDYFYDDGVCVIEWAERLEGLLPEEHLWVHIKWVDENCRRLRLTASGARYAQYLAALEVER